MKEIITFLHERTEIIIKTKTKHRLDIVAVVIVMLFAFVSVSGCNGTPGQTRELAFPDAGVSGELQFTAAGDDDAISIPATTGLVVAGGAKDQDLTFSNPESNNCYFQISVYLSDGTLLFCTDLISPGDSVDGVSLSTELDAGVYSNAVLVYDCFTQDIQRKPLTRCELVIEIDAE